MAFGVIIPNLATNWSDTHGDTISLSTVNFPTTNNFSLCTNIRYLKIMVSKNVLAAFSINGIIPGATNQVTQRSKEHPPSSAYYRLK